MKKKTVSIYCLYKGYMDAAFTHVSALASIIDETLFVIPMFSVSFILGCYGGAYCH